MPLRAAAIRLGGAKADACTGVLNRTIGKGVRMSSLWLAVPIISWFKLLGESMRLVCKDFAVVIVLLVTALDGRSMHAQ